MMEGYTATLYKNPLSFRNPVTEFFDALDRRTALWKEQWDTAMYWLNPLNWFIEANRGLHWLVNQPETGITLMIGTMAGITLVMLGARWPKKYMYWSWIVYWLLRGFIYRNGGM